MKALDILQKNNIKKTPARIAIIKALQLSQSPMSESDIKSEMGDMYDRVTFYRNVQTLIDAGIIHRIVVNNVVVKYALNKLNEDSSAHVHFFCESCKKVKCLENIESGNYTLPNGYLLTECDVIIRGICPQCK